ncbi:MAG: phosphoribosyltransferase [Acidimicrobiia bacterium]|nr:phosphoribosyltransferase [Acidimicrobiia bacterium]
MVTVREIAEPLADMCVPVPYRGDGICVRCHTRPRPGFDLCWSCRTVERRLTAPCSVLVPVSLYQIGSQLHQALRYYKDGRYPARAARFSRDVAAVLARFLALHEECITAAGRGPWDVITSVPSSIGRPGEHPLVRALRHVPAVFEQYEPLLAQGDEPVNHVRPADRAYRVTAAVGGRRVLLVDDTLTSGARAQSAASALNVAGANVVAIVPVGRVVDRSWAHLSDWWNDRSRMPFSFETCCLDAF